MNRGIFNQVNFLKAQKRLEYKLVNVLVNSEYAIKVR